MLAQTAQQLSLDPSVLQAACRDLQSADTAQATPRAARHNARRNKRTVVRQFQDTLFDLGQIECSICGHVDCGHTAADRRYHRALDRRVLPHRQVSIAAALSEQAWESYSGDTIAEHDTIRKPFLFESKLDGAILARRLWRRITDAPSCNIGGTRQKFEGYRVVERSQFHERTFRDSDRAGFRRTPYYDPRLKEQFAGDQRRHAPKGYYHGVRVKRGGKEYVLVGPPVEFVVLPDESRRSKRTLFGNFQPTTGRKLMPSPTPDLEKQRKIFENVRAEIRKALDEIRTHDPELAAHLEANIIFDDEKLTVPV